MAERILRRAHELGQNARILDWEVNQLPPDQIVPGKRVLWLSNIARRMFITMRKEYDSWDDDKIRQKILDTEPLMVEFKKTHKTIFATFTSRKTTNEALLRVIKLIKLRIQHEDNPENEYNNQLETMAFIYGKYLTKQEKEE